MADDTIIVKLTPRLKRRLEEAARRAGQTIEDYVAWTLAEHMPPGMAEEPVLFDDADQAALAKTMTPAALDFQRKAALEALAEYDLTGRSVDAETTLDGFVARVRERAVRRS